VLDAFIEFDVEGISPLAVLAVGLVGTLQTSDRTGCAGLQGIPEEFWGAIHTREGVVAISAAHIALLASVTRVKEVRFFAFDATEGVEASVTTFRAGIAEKIRVQVKPWFAN